LPAFVAGEEQETTPYAGKSVVRGEGSAPSSDGSCVSRKSRNRVGVANGTIGGVFVSRWVGGRRHGSNGVGVHLLETLGHSRGAPAS